MVQYSPTAHCGESASGDRKAVPELAGIISIDDLIELLAAEMGELAKLISKEQDEEIRRKPTD